MLGNKSEIDEDSDTEISNEETSHLLIPDTQQPTSKELDKLLSDGELDSDDESEDDWLLTDIINKHATVKEQVTKAKSLLIWTVTWDGLY